MMSGVVQAKFIASLIDIMKAKQVLPLYPPPSSTRPAPLLLQLSPNLPAGSRARLLHWVHGSVHGLSCGGGGDSYEPGARPRDRRHSEEEH
eukprot:746395-Hanusia_phi.AAC.3